MVNTEETDRGSAPLRVPTRPPLQKSPLAINFSHQRVRTAMRLEEDAGA
jgi:hypothetical protein